MNDKYELFFEVIKYYEGFEAKPYRDSVGVLTIGFGRTMGDLRSTTTPEIEKQWVLQHAEKLNGQLNNLIVPRMNAYQMAALLSFTYNLGTGSLSRSTLRKLINQNDINRAGDEFLKWSKAGGNVLPGLVKRRMTEYVLWKNSKLLLF